MLYEVITLTVQPQKLTPNDAVEILSEYCEKRFLLNSDSSVITSYSIHYTKLYDV